MTCPLCGIGILPGKVCLGCGYDPSKPGVRPRVKAGPPPPRPFPAQSSRNTASTTPEKKAARFKPKEMAQDTEDLIDESAVMKSAGARPAAQQPAAQPLPPVSQRPKLPDETVQVTTQSDFEGHRIVAYAGLLVASVAVRVGEPSELSAEGQDIRRLTGGPIGPIGLRLRKAIDVAIADLKMDAMDRKANAVVGLRFEFLPVHGNMVILTALGTAVTLET